MSEEKKEFYITKELRQHLLRPLLRFEPKSAEVLAAEKKAVPKIGSRMGDGTIYAGVSPDTNQPMYAAPTDAPKGLSFSAAARYARNLKVDGRKGFRVPTLAEMEVLYKNRKKGALKGTFNFAGSFYGGLYRSSARIEGNGVIYKRFSEGSQVQLHKDDTDAHLRCVR